MYKDMHEWLKYKPTMSLPHFRDLMNLIDRNYTSQQGADNDNADGKGKSLLHERSSLDHVLHAYASASTHDAAKDSVETWEEDPQETEATPGEN
jgi:hypothetical protein